MSPMGTKSRETLYGSTIRATAERAQEARKEADRLACEAWNYHMLGYQGPAQPSPTLGDALIARFIYLEVRCLVATDRGARYCSPAENQASLRTRRGHVAMQIAVLRALYTVLGVMTDS